jgi:hypothetical protein
MNWDNWTEIRVELWGAGPGPNGTTASTLQYLLVADAPTLAHTESFDMRLSGNVSGGGMEFYIENSDSDVFSRDDDTIDPTVAHDLGVRIYRNDNGSGHTMEWYVDGRYISGSSENKEFPAATDLTITHGVRSTNSTASVRRADGWQIQLIR